MLMQWNMEGWTSFFAGPDTKFSKAFIKALVDFAKDRYINTVNLESHFINFMMCYSNFVLIGYTR